jgi:hypothetical protein
LQNLKLTNRNIFLENEKTMQMRLVTKLLINYRKKHVRVTNQ